MFMRYYIQSITEAKRESDKEVLAKDKADGKAVNEGTTQPTIPKKKLKTDLINNDIDWVNKNISEKFQCL